MKEKKYVLVNNRNGNPRDPLLSGIGYTVVGNWSRRLVHTRDDGYGTEYVILDGLEYDLDDLTNRLNYIPCDKDGQPC